MAALEMSGCSIQLRSSRLPMAVLVLSSTQSSVPRFSRPRSVSVSSRLARVTCDSRMNWASLYVMTVFRRSTPLILRIIGDSPAARPLQSGQGRLL